jgi:VWFA-related protein
MRRRQVASVAAAAIAMTVAARGQTQTPSSVHKPPQFTAATHLVEVDVAVVDRQGRPVTDLTAADFELREDGQPQHIQTVYLAAIAPGAARLPTQPEDEARALPAVRPLPSRMFVFVVDTPHLSADGLTRTRAALTHFLSSGLGGTDLAGLVVNGSMIGNRIDADTARLRAALDALRMPPPARANELRTFPRILDDAEAARIARDDQTVVDRVVQRACAERPGECSGPAGQDIVRRDVESKGRRLAAEAAQMAQATLSALQTLASSLGRFPGPKHVIVFSEGFYVDDLGAWLQQMVARAAASGVRFTVIDARGIGRDPRSADPFGAQPMTASGDLTPVGGDTSLDVLTSLALDTGGRIVRNHNDAAPVLERIVAETATYYVLGYSPSKAPDGTFRRISVRVARPDVVVRARRGYTASANVVEHREPAPADAPPASVSTPPPASTPAVRPGSQERIAALVTKAPPPARSGAGAARLAAEGWALFREGKVEESQTKFAAAVASGEASVWVYYALGQAEFALQRYEPAIRAWEVVRRNAADYQAVYLDLADGYFQLGQTDNAIAVLRDAERRWPGESEVHNALGVILARRELLDDAIASFERAVAAAPDDGLGYFNLGRTYQLRYLRRLRTSSRTGAAGATAADRDRQRAVGAFTAYLKIGGPFESQAREALSVLQWKTPGQV